MLHTVVRAYVESYGVSLTSSSLPPHRPDTILFPGIAIKASATSAEGATSAASVTPATSAASVTHATSLSFPLKGEGSGDITAIKQNSLTYSNTNNNTTATTLTHTYPTTTTTNNNNNSTITSISNKSGQNYVPAENITIKNMNFIHLIENDIKNNKIYQFCNNLDSSLFEVKLLGGRLFECTTDSSNNNSNNTNISGSNSSSNAIDISANSIANYNASNSTNNNISNSNISNSTTAAAVVIRDEPTSLEVARNQPNFDQFCGTICVQVRVYIYTHTLTCIVLSIVLFSLTIYACMICMYYI